MCTSGGDSQAKVDDLFGDIKYVIMYINDIIILNKVFLTKHI